MDREKMTKVKLLCIKGMEIQNFAYLGEKFIFTDGEIYDGYYDEEYEDYFLYVEAIDELYHLNYDCELKKNFVVWDNVIDDCNTMMDFFKEIKEIKVRFLNGIKFSPYKIRGIKANIEIEEYEENTICTMVKKDGLFYPVVNGKIKKCCFDEVDIMERFELLEINGMEVQ